MDQDFVGGAIDCRGRIVSVEQPARNKLSFWLSDRLRMNSVNGALLKALQSTHGGRLVQVKNKDEIIDNKTPTTLRSGF